MSSRRAPALASALVACASLVLTGCGGDANGDASTNTTSSPTSSTSSASSTGSGTPTASGSSTESSESPTPDPYAIDCSRVEQRVVDQWTKGAEPATAEPTEKGCRVVSSSYDGALLVEWRYLDVTPTSGDGKFVRELGRLGEAVDLTPELSGLRSETDVEPTRKTRVMTTYADGRTLYVEATATLDRPLTLDDLRRMTTAVATIYKDQLGPSTTTR